MLLYSRRRKSSRHNQRGWQRKDVVGGYAGCSVQSTVIDRRVENAGRRQVTSLSHDRLQALGSFKQFKWERHVEQLARIAERGGHTFVVVERLFAQHDAVANEL